MLEPIVAYINENYGSKRGLLRTAKFALVRQCGGYNKMRDIDWLAVQRMIFICSGNICRSPLAEICATSLGLQAESYGLACGDGFPADPRAIDFAAGKGLNLSDHRTRNIASYVPASGDVLIGMEPWHADALQKYRGDRAKLTLAGLWLKEPTAYLHDPFSSSVVFFEKCERSVVESVENIARLSISRGR